MKYRMLNYLVCPACGGELMLTVFKENQVQAAGVCEVKRCEWRCAFGERRNSAPSTDCTLCITQETEAGMLSCSCGNVYPVADGIPRMLPDAFSELDGFLETHKDFLVRENANKGSHKAASFEQSMNLQEKTKESFGYQWLRYTVNDPIEDRTVFLSDAQLSDESLHDKLVLDAGCGMGRYTAVAAGMGAEIIGLDLSRSILKAYEKTRIHPLAHIVQADILNLPFRKSLFDLIYSLGVLHHTPDPRRAFLNLVACLKSDGMISVWLYGAAGQFSDFKTNPLRTDRKQYLKSNLAKRLHWLIVSQRESAYKCVRLMSTRMNVPLLYMICYPLAAMGKIPLLKYLTASVHPNWRVRLQENFDWFSPHYQSHHTKEEIQEWCAEAQVDVISLLKHGFIPKVGIKGVLRKRV